MSNWYGQLQCLPSDEDTWLDLDRKDPLQLPPPTASSLAALPSQSPPHRRAPPTPPPPALFLRGCTLLPNTHRQASTERKGRAREAGARRPVVEVQEVSAIKPSPSPTPAQTERVLPVWLSLLAPGEHEQGTRKLPVSRQALSSLCNLIVSNWSGFLFFLLAPGQHEQGTRKSFQCQSQAALHNLILSHSKALFMDIKEQKALKLKATNLMPNSHVTAIIRARKLTLDVPWLRLTLGPSEWALEEFKRMNRQEDKGDESDMVALRRRPE
nr:uncharacterized protein LOC117849349 [Setaria viridis]